MRKMILMILAILVFDVVLLKADVYKQKVLYGDKWYTQTVEQEYFDKVVTSDQIVKVVEGNGNQAEAPGSVKSIHYEIKVGPKAAEIGYKRIKLIKYIENK